MRLVYFAPSDIQVPRVDRQCIVNFCDALQNIGVDVELVAIGIRLHSSERVNPDPLAVYRIRRRFPVRIIEVPVHQDSADWWIGLNRLVVQCRRALAEAIAARRDRTTVFYTKNFGPAAAMLIVRSLARRSVQIAFEAHYPPPTSLHRRVLASCDRIIANTHALAAVLVRDHAIEPDRVIGTHQGVDLDLFDEMRIPRDEARAQLGLPLDRRLAIYTGKVGWGYREVEHILDAARALASRSDICFVIVGGRADNVDKYRELVAREGLTNVIFTGFVAPNEVQSYQFAADALLLYYPSGIAINDFRSPGKLFEYLAAGRPVISVDLPVLREVLGDDPAAVMVPQDAPLLLAEATARLLDDPAECERLGRRSLEIARQFTWEARARMIRSFIEHDDPH